LRERFASFGMIAVVGFVLVVAFGANALLAYLTSRYFSSVIGVPAVLAAIDVVLNIGIIGFIFAALFKVLPDVKLKWKDVLVGGYVTAVLFARLRLHTRRASLDLLLSDDSSDRGRVH